MGNSGSGHHHAYKTPPSQMQQYVQSLPREGRGRGTSSAAAQKYYNGGFKVLPERVPGQKLRLTDNGNLLQNGGTLSGRRLGGGEPTEPDPEFMRMLKRRSEIIEGSIDDHEMGQHSKVDGSLRKKYHSNPDLLNSHGIISGNPSGLETKKKKAQKKSKAPPPPQHYSEDEMMTPHYYAMDGPGPAKDKKRHFPNFLKPASKKGHDAKNKLPPVERQDFNNVGAHHQNHLRSSPGPPSTINAEITAAKLDSRDKSVTYVLERRDYHSSTTILNVSGGSAQVPFDHPDGPNLTDRRYGKRAQSPDGSSSKPPASTHSLYHPNFQAKLSDGGLQAMSIDRSEIRNRMYDLQKRVRSMDSLAMDSSDDRDIYFGNQHNNPLRIPPHSKDANATTNRSPDNAKTSHNVPLRRHPSNSSSLASQGQSDRLPWQKSPSRTNLSAERPVSVPYSTMQDGNGPNSKQDPLHRSDSNNRKAFYYGSEQKSQPTGQNQVRDSFPGSLDRQGNGIDSRVPRQRPSSAIPQSPRNHKVAAKEDRGERENGDGGQRSSSVEPTKNFRQHGYNQNLDHFSKDKLRPMNSKEILGKEIKNDNFATAKGTKEYHDKDVIVSDHLQEVFFAKTKETRAGVVEYNRKLASGRQQRESVPGNKMDGDLSSEDEMDINMQLRPTLPKRLPAMPRFSPTQVWRSFSLDDSGAAADKSSDRSSDDGEEGDVFEDRIQRIARPVAPPRSNNEKSADSGISPGAVSPIQAFYDFDAVVAVPPEKSSTASNPPTVLPPLPPPLMTTARSSGQQHLPSYPPAPISPMGAKDGTHGANHSRHVHNYESPMTGADKKSHWTPEEDLASDFDAGSADHTAPSSTWNVLAPEMILTQPKLTSRKEMFVSRRSPNGACPEKDSKSDHSDAETKNGKGNRKSKNGKNGGEPNSPQKYNSIRKLKRSLSGVLQGHSRSRNGEEGHRSLDDNWSLSRSLPNSLHNGHEGERSEPKTSSKLNRTPTSEMGQQRLPRSESGPIYVGQMQESNVERQPFADLEGQAFSRERAQSAVNVSSPGMRYNRNGHIVYLPKYEAMEIIAENDPLGGERRAYSDLGTGVKESTTNGHHFPFKKPKKFTYQSTVRQIERKQLEQKLSQEVAMKELQREREMDLVNKVEEEFQRKRDKEKDDIQQQLRILSLESIQNEETSNGYLENTRSLPREYPVYNDRGGGRHHKDGVDLHENGSMERNDRNHLSLPTLVIPPEDYDLTLPREYSKNKLGSLPGKNGREQSQLPTKLTTPSHAKNGTSGSSAAGSSSGFFSGIGKWMRRQQRLEQHSDHGPSRQEPEGAPSSFGANGAPSYDDPHSFSGSLAPTHSPSSPHHENRSTALTGAKYSSGRIPDGQSYLKPMPISPRQRKNIYTHLAEVAEKEENFRKQHGHHGEKDARTSVWISQDVKAPNSKTADALNKNSIGGNDFYQVPYDSLRNGINGKKDFRHGSNIRHNNLQNETIDREQYNRLHNTLQKERNAGQRHSIAIDPSRDHWTSGLIPPPQGYEDRQPTQDNKHRGFNVLSTQNNEAPSGDTSWNQGISRQDSYRESLEGSSTEYRRQYTELPALNAHQRSLSFSHIWDGDISNGRKPDNTSPRPAVPPVQPFTPNKSYRPVAFQAKQYRPPK